MSDQPRYWFPAKRYGWGWGTPTTWQGWVVMLFFLALLAFGVVVVLPQLGRGVFVLFSLLLAAIFFLVCWFKGEPPRWRWGDKRQ